MTTLDSVAVQLQALEQELAEARAVAFSAMQEVSELGVVIDFFRQLQACRSVVEVGRLLKEILERFDLQSVLKLTSADGTVLCVPDEVATAVFSGFPSPPPRICRSQSDNLLVTFPSISLYVSGSVLTSENAGRLRDHLAMLAEGVETHLVTLSANIHTKMSP